MYLHQGIRALVTEGARDPVLRVKETGDARSGDELIGIAVEEIDATPRALGWIIIAGQRIVAQTFHGRRVKLHFACRGRKSVLEVLPKNARTSEVTPFAKLFPTQTRWRKNLVERVPDRRPPEAWVGASFPELIEDIVIRAAISDLHRFLASLHRAVPLPQIGHIIVFQPCG